MNSRGNRFMSTLNDLTAKARGLRQRGLTEREIADELNLQVDTIEWLLRRDKGIEVKPPPMDYSVNWSTVGASPTRLNLIATALADLAHEGLQNGEFESFDIVLGVELAGAPIAVIIAEKLGKAYASARAAHKESVEASELLMGGTVCTNFASVENRKVLLVTDVISTGIILADTARALKELGATPVGMIAFVDKRGEGSIDGIPVKSLIKHYALKK